MPVERHMIFTSAVLIFPSPLATHLFAILAASTQVQMRRINARWRIARMQDAHPFWNWPIEKLPGNTIGTNWTFGPCSRYLPVSTFGSQAASPQPAFIWTFCDDLAPEAAFNRCRWLTHF
jgi:hypothetical protein